MTLCCHGVNVVILKEHLLCTQLEYYDYGS